MAMSTFTTVYKLLQGLLPEVPGDAVATTIVQELYKRAVESTHRNASLCFTSGWDIKLAVDSAYKILVPLARSQSPGAARKLHSVVELGGGRDAVFSAVGSVVAGANAQLQQLVITVGQELGASNLVALHTSMAKLAGVQQTEMANSIGAMAQSVRTQKEASGDEDFSEAVSGFTEVGGCLMTPYC